MLQILSQLRPLRAALAVALLTLGELGRVFILCPETEDLRVMSVSVASINSRVHDVLHLILHNSSFGLVTFVHL